MSHLVGPWLKSGLLLRAMVCFLSTPPTSSQPLRQLRGGKEVSELPCEEGLGFDSTSEDPVVLQYDVFSLLADVWECFPEGTVVCWLF